MKPLEHELRRALSVSAAPDADALNAPCTCAGYSRPAVPGPGGGN